MKKISIVALSILLASCSSTKSQKQADVSRYMNTITSDELKTHLYIVASDENEGRDTGSEGQKKAGKYLVAQYEKNGISYPKAANGWYQKVPSEFMARGFAP